ncbi:MAG: hypothetical protein QXQ79_00075 [Candidatus Nanoarchaeia archaeon]
MPKNLLDPLKKIAALEKNLTFQNKTLKKTNAQIKSLEKNLKASKKETALLYSNNKDLQKEIDKLRSAVTNLAKTTNNLTSELKEIKTEIGTYKKDINAKTENLRKETNVTSLKLTEIISLLNKDLENLKEKVSVIENTWNSDTLNSLVSEIKTISLNAKDLKKQSEKNLKNFDRINAGLVAIAKHSEDIKHEQQTSQEFAAELSKKSENLEKTAQSFFTSVDALNSKLNISVSALNDLASVVENLKMQLNDAENKINTLLNLQSVVAENNAILSELKKRLEYLEKVTVKTVVIS